MNEHQRKAAAIVALAELLGRQLTDAAAKLYVAALADIPAATVERAALEAARTCNGFMPPPSELRERCGISRPEDRALLAWNMVEKALYAVGPYNHVDFEDRVINATIRHLGGWTQFIDQSFSDAESEKFARKEFIRAYQSLHRARVDGEACEPLVGLSEATVIGTKVYKAIPRRVECEYLPQHERARLTRQEPKLIEYRGQP